MGAMSRWVGGVCAGLVLAGCGGGGSDAPSAAAVQDGAERAQALALVPPGTPIPPDASVKGVFGPLKTWPLVAVHGVLTSDGRVLSYGTRTTGQQTAFFEYDIWDPVADNHLTLANNTAVDIFCSSQLLLADGSGVVLNGGDNWTGQATTNTGNNRSTVFNVANNGLTAGNNMNSPRWYSSSTMLLNGEVYIQGGSGGTARPEIRGNNGVYRLLSGANTSALDSMYPRNFVAPDGRVFGYDSVGRMYYVNTTGTGLLTSVGQFAAANSGSDSSAAMFATGRILQYGGNSNQAIIIDITGGGTPSISNTGAMLRQRRLSVATLLPNGRVLATGGSRVWNQMTDVSYEAEIWNPQTGQWTVGAVAQRPRLYHGNALLLPDASVLVFGGGAPAPTGSTNQLNAEIYYPPYLFTAAGAEAARPTIDTAPTVVDTGRTVQLAVTSARPIQRVTFIKTGSATHGWNMEQRFVDLPFSAQGNTLSVQIPARASDVPPGMWMMFVLDDAGVPSAAKLVRVNVAAALNVSVAPVLTAPPPQASLQGSAVSLQLAATDPNGDTLTYSASGLPPGLAINPATGLIAGVPTTAGTYTVVVAASDGFNSASATITWSVNPAAALVLDPPPAAAPSVTGSGASFTASATGINVRYRWDFGDGSPLSAWSSSAAATHVYANPGAYFVTVIAIDDRNIEQRRTILHNAYLPLTTGKPSISANLLYETRSGANARLWAVNQDNDSVTVFDAVTRAKLAEVTVGSAPRTLALAPDGASVWVVNKQGATLSVIATASLAVTRTISLARGSQPYGIAFAGGASNAALVTLEATGTLLKIEPAGGTVLSSLPLGANPRHIAVAADGVTTYVSRFVTPPLPGEATDNVATTAAGQPVGGEVLVLNAVTMAVQRTVVLAHSDKTDAENQGRGFPNYLGALAISPDGSQGFVPSKQDNLRRGGARDGFTLNFQNTVRAISSRVVLGAAPAEDLAARIDHDNASVASAAAFDPLGVYLFVALETSREVAVLDAHGRNQLMRIDVGRAPQGLAVSADRRTLYVHNFMDRTVGVFDLSPLMQQGVAAATPVATLSAVASERLAPTVFTGKQHFYDARDPRLALDRYMSCATCHNDGGQDGRVWDLTSQGEGLRNTINLRGRAGMGQGFLHWSNNFDEIQDFEGQIRTLAGGTGLMSNAQYNTGTRNTPLGDAKAGVSADLDALAAYVASLDSFAPSPTRPSATTLSTTALEGRALFGSLNCASCHGGSAFTNSGLNTPLDVGTLKQPTSGSRLSGPLAGIDIPTLRDVWATAPYLHDGSAPTLEAAIRSHNVVSASDADVARVAQYLREIGSEEPGTGAAAGTELTIWPSSTVPAVATASDTGSVNLGVKFRSDQAGFITGIRFYKGAGNTGTHIGALWSEAGTLLASATFTNETATGWQQVRFASPVAVTANTTYVASYLAPSGGYSYNNAYFASAGFDNVPLHALPNSVTGGNGVYRYGAGNLFPNSTYQAFNYWVDVLFSASTGGDATPPTVSATTPAANASGVAVNTTVAATFSEAMDATSIGGATVELRSATNVLVPSSVSYNVATRVMTLAPGAALATSTTYVATIRGGSSGARVRDAAGNAMAANVTWSFTTAAPPDTTPPTISAFTPASGATGVATNVVVSVTFSEAMDAATIGAASIELRNAASALVPASVGYNAATRVATLTPSAGLTASSTYSVTVRGGATDPRVKDTAGNALAASATWSFTTAAVVDSTPPTVTTMSPIGGATGVATTVAPSATFSEAMDPATISGSTIELRTAANALVSATVSYNAATRVATLQPASALAASTSYTLTVRGGGTDPRVRDVAGNALAANAIATFTTAAAPDTTPPTVSAFTPANGATGIAASSAVTVSFSEAMDAATINGSTIELRNAANALVAATLSWNAATRVATLTPSAALAASTTYTATVRGGASDPRVKDVAGNALAANASWSFTTAAAGACPCSLWPASATPASASWADTGSVNLGVKFRSDQAGFITGIRFYKGAANTGTHIGALWSSTGTLLASATFTNETATGWQQVNFATPVAITANTVYVASYLAPNGGYAVNSGFFTSAGVDNGLLHAPATGVVAGNGVYRYGAGNLFPNATYNAANYWVDVVFTP